eukprot:CAMPEP_0205947410 /NCGR_PEP_ID=MMETSP1325-20131115/69547_1 /ASSEMBLY_ACC=CAM_ASM_000708 /TAXON_ID=236786 /ORGANISM="Florenciella sp., Strain RCC1007" /LENGTH=61 /DNA_ID=CAMNT_0053318513 /DNA_START=35 /DNA_END=220 /DNA_ORIENTATION=+
MGHRQFEAAFGLSISPSPSSARRKQESRFMASAGSATGVGSSVGRSESVVLPVMDVQKQGS